ncbi:MAG: hypothetical protein IJ493_07815 [Clostridia bacterium]|nr:hypothetical protein [Clostridia bacterium]
MKRIAILFLIGALLLIAPLTAVAAVTVNAEPQYEDTFLGELADKHERLASVEGPRIVLIGGSSLAFGLDSALLEEYTGLPVVNYGLYATIGTKAMLDLSRSYIREGDIIVLCPETDAQTYSLYYNGRSMWQAIDCDYSLLWDVGSDNWGKLLSTLPEFAAEKMGFVRSGSKPAPQGIYAHSSFNEYGDVSAERVYNEMPSNYDTAQPITLSTALVDDEFIDYLNEYAAYAQSKGAQVYFSFSPINEEAVISTEEEKEAFYRALGEGLDFPLLSDVDDYILPSAYFYDTNFHLNSRGALMRTALLADDLLRAMGVTEYVETVKYSAPQRPEDYFALAMADDENSKFFTFSEIDGGLMISGLSETGLTAETVTVPRAKDGKAVLAIGDNAFAGSNTLKTMIIDENSSLKSFSSDALKGSSLQRIEIYLEPSQLTINAAVMQNLPSGCFIYIPEEQYGNFATDYFWSSQMKHVKTME